MEPYALIWHFRNNLPSPCGIFYKAAQEFSVYAAKKEKMRFEIIAANVCHRRNITFFAVMYNYHPLRSDNSSIPRQNFSRCVNNICDGSPSRIRIVLLISLGITTLPRSSPRVKYSPRIFLILYFTGFWALFDFSEKGKE